MARVAVEANRPAGLLLALLLLVPSLVQAEVPKAIINGPTTAVVGWEAG